MSLQGSKKSDEKKREKKEKKENKSSEVSSKVIKNPIEIRFVHETISTTLSKPKPGEKQAPNLDALAAVIQKGEQSMLDFPPITVFSIRDPQSRELHCYSLSNRKLYLAKKSQSPEIDTIQATFREILDSTWKFTSSSDGLRYPTPTHDGNKESEPTGLLARFKNFIETRQALYPLNFPKNSSETVEERILRESQEEFEIECIPKLN